MAIRNQDHSLFTIFLVSDLVDLPRLPVDDVFVFVDTVAGDVLYFMESSIIVFP